MSYTDENVDLALQYANAGIYVFPCVGHGDDRKKPCRGIFWKSVASIDESTIRGWWERFPDAVPGLPAERNGKIIIDCDCKGESNGLDWAREHVGGDLDGIPGSDTPGKGRHLIYSNTIGHGDGRGSLPAAFKGDIKGKGYVLAPGARMADGSYYAPRGSIADIVNAPPLSAEWIAFLAAAPVAPPVPLMPVPPAHAIGATRPIISEYCNDLWGQAALRGMEVEIATESQGERNNTANEVAFRAGRMVAGNLFSYNEALARLFNAAVKVGLPHREARSTVIRALTDGMTKGKPISGATNDTNEPYPFNTDKLVATGFAKQEALARDRVTGEEVDPLDYNPETGEMLEEAKPPSAGTPEHLLKVPGLVGEIAEWITATAIYPQPALALGAALIIVGTAAGRLLGGPTRSGTHLYIVGLAASGAGKDHPLVAIPRVLIAAELKGHVGPSQFISMPAALNAIKRCPLLACPIDELGVFLKRINGRNSSSFERSISGILRTAWGASFKPYTLPEWAARPAEIIFSPALSIYGMSTKEDFYSGLEGADIKNGLLNRFILIETEGRPAEQSPTSDPDAVPTEITEALREIYFRDPLAMQRQADMRAKYEMLKFSEDAEQVYRDLSAAMKIRMDAYPEMGNFLVRVAENAVRLATISTIGQGSMTIDAPTMIWAKDFVTYSFDRLADQAGLYIADSDSEAMANMYRRELTGKGWVLRRPMMRKIGYRYKPREMTEVLKEMILRGEILEFTRGAQNPADKWPEAADKVPGSADKLKGRPGTWYYLTTKP